MDKKGTYRHRPQSNFGGLWSILSCWSESIRIEEKFHSPRDSEQTSRVQDCWMPGSGFKSLDVKMQQSEVDERLTPSASENEQSALCLSGRSDPTWRRYKENREPHKQGINARNWEVRLMVQNNESKRKQEGRERQVGTCVREKEKIIDNRSDPNLIQTAKNLNHEGIRDVPQCKGAVEEIQGLNVDLEAFGALAKKLVFATGQRDKARGGCRPKAVWERASSKSDGTES
ncbi:hypothetical protein B0H11DRAFT_1920048 [Mycena galericulata]|nr:hypothetical protein B0H11DRAFT_1920048 [Mycena galericulata]